MNIKYKGESYFLYNKCFEYSSATVICKADLINVSGGDKIEVHGKAWKASAAYFNMLDTIHDQLHEMNLIKKKETSKKNEACPQKKL